MFITAFTGAPTCPILNPDPWQVFMIRNKTISFTVRSCRYLALPPKQEDHPLLDFRDCLFNIFTATLHIGGRSSIRNLRTRHAVMTGSLVNILETHLPGTGWTLSTCVCQVFQCVCRLSRLFAALDLPPPVFQLPCPVRSLWRNKKCGYRASR
jgi:hypothetical protein